MMTLARLFARKMYEHKTKHQVLYLRACIYQKTQLIKLAHSLQSPWTFVEIIPHKILTTLALMKTISTQYSVVLVMKHSIYLLSKVNFLLLDLIWIYQKRNQKTKQLYHLVLISSRLHSEILSVSFNQLH